MISLIRPPIWFKIAGEKDGFISQQENAVVVGAVSLRNRDEAVEEVVPLISRRRWRGGGEVLAVEVDGFAVRITADDHLRYASVI